MGRIAVVLALTSGCGRGPPTDATPADACAFGPFGNLRRGSNVIIAATDLLYCAADRAV